MKMDEQLAELILEYAKPECRFLPIFYDVSIEFNCVGHNEVEMDENVFSDPGTGALRPVMVQAVNIG